MEREFVLSADDPTSPAIRFVGSAADLTSRKTGLGCFGILAAIVLVCVILWALSNGGGWQQAVACDSSCGVLHSNGPVGGGVATIDFKTTYGGGGRGVGYSEFSRNALSPNTMGEEDAYDETKTKNVRDVLRQMHSEDPLEGGVPDSLCGVSAWRL